VAGLSGVIVTGVEPESVAAESGIQRGDVILSVNQRRVTNLKEYGAAMKQAQQRGAVALLVKRGGQSIYFALKIK
jgi:serine protease Do